MSLLTDPVARGRTGLSIGGEWRASSDGGTTEVLDPATAEPLATVANGTTDDARAAVDAAASAVPAWSFDLMVARSDETAQLIVQEMGKPLAEAKGEAVFAAGFFRWYSGEAVRNHGTVLTTPAGDKRIISIHQPVGVSLPITPFKFPASMATRKIAPAIAAGCTVVLKPASARVVHGFDRGGKGATGRSLATT